MRNDQIFSVWQKEIVLFLSLPMFHNHWRLAWCFWFDYMTDRDERAVGMFWNRLGRRIRATSGGQDGRTSFYEMIIDFHLRRCEEHCQTKESRLLWPKRSTVDETRQIYLRETNFFQIQSANIQNDNVRWIFDGAVMHLRIDFRVCFSLEWTFRSSAREETHDEEAIE